MNGWLCKIFRFLIQLRLGLYQSGSFHPASQTKIGFKDFSILERDSNIIEVKNCEDTRPQNQLSATQEQHKGLYSTLQGASITIHTILLGVDGTSYNNHTLEPFMELVPDYQRVTSPASKLHVHSVHYAAEHLYTRRALLSTQ